MSHQQQPYAAPTAQPPKKRKVGKVAGLGCLGVVAVVVIAAVAGGGGGDSGDTSKKDKAVTAVDTPRKDTTDKAPAKKEKTQAQEFQECVAADGTATEKAAARHVTKVTGADKRNDILDSAEVFTDFSGGMTGPHQGEGKLIASAFTSCYESKNGLVTVYDKNGEILANANY
ncbi:hypothetical protein AB0E88_19645 [Streptomyces sp. NPDC028635]|uniref:hypothetical protein n=1 Tax=Streptomyces sp. NPDC028635 TaxID=3154800 RepID=UPI0033E41878